MFRVAENLKVVQHITRELRDNTTVSGDGSNEGPDCSQFDEAICVVSVQDTDTTVDCKVQESDDNSTWADITGAAITQLSGTDDAKVAAISVDRSKGTRKKYHRAVLAVGDGTLGADVGVDFLLTKPKDAPVASGVTELVKV